VHRLVPFFAAACLTAVVLAPTATSAERMWVGFHDDPVLRYDDGREPEMATARSTGASITRTLVTWANIAPSRPGNATNSFDPAYRFDDLDDFVRNAQKQGVEVLMTLWGTPKWANGGKTPNFLPRKMSDFQNFARAVASRYSGRNAGYPFVRFYGIWNESNLGQFLSPQFNSSGKIVGPALYSKLATAGYVGIKSVSPRALVGIGETSARGRDKKKAGVSDTVSPGKFAELVAKANPKQRFDAWDHHPYPNPISGKPTQVVRWPNVSLRSMPRFEKSLDMWFKRKNTRLWITEYGHETKPGEPRGVSESAQAAYVTQSMAMAKKDPRVDMFIWFVLRDSSGSEWQSGVFRTDGSAKPSQPRFVAASRGLSPVNGKITVRGGTKNPAVKLYLREFCQNNATGSAVGTTARSYLRGKLVQVSQQQVPLAVDCAANVRVTGLTVAKKKSYVVQFEANTAISGTVQRTITVVGG
jgi:Cellulase (glycosyl hydrolase family 5)